MSGSVPATRHEEEQAMTGEDAAPQVAHVHVDGTTWPVPDGAEWVLRYGTPEAREALRMGIASVLSAYSSLLDPIRTQGEAIEMLKRGRRAVAEHFGSNARARSVFPVGDTDA